MDDWSARFQQLRGEQSTFVLEGEERTLFSSVSQLKQLQPVLLFIIGFSLFKTWEEIFFIGSAVSYPEININWPQVLFFVKSVTFLSCALLADKLRQMYAKKLSYVTAGVLLSLSTLCMALALYKPEVALLLVLAGTIIGGIGVGLITLLWCGLCDLLNPTLAVLCYLIASIVAPFVMISGYNLPTPLLIAVAFTLPFASLIAIAFGLHPLLHERTAPSRVKEHPSPAKILVLMAVFGFTFAMREPLMNNAVFGSASYTAFGSILIAGIVFLGIALLGNRFSLVFLFRVVLPLTAVAFLLLPTNITLTKAVSDLCSAASIELVEILNVLVLANLSYRYHMSAVRLFGLSYGVQFLFVFLGRFAWNIFASFGLNDVGITLWFSIISAIAIALTILLIPDNDTFRKWGLNLIEDEPNTTPFTPEQEFKYRCHEFAKERALTAREEDILLLLVKNRTNSQIQNELCISKETVKTHRRNIYTKCDVHSRDELISLMGLDR